MVQNVFGVKLTQKQTMIIARLTVVVIAVIALFLAADPDSNVFQIVSFAWAGFGATFGPAMLCALFWRRSNRQGIMAGLVEFSADYAWIQRKLLMDLHIPYAIVDESGRILWTNTQFSKIIKQERGVSRPSPPCFRM